MRVGVPTEIKNNEYRVAITPGGVAELTRRGHDVVIQAGAGEGSAISDTDFKFAGAEVISGAEHVWEHADLLLKVKEPIEPEYALMHRGQLRAVGTPTKLKSAVAPGATLEDVFRHYATEDMSSEMGASGTPKSGSFREIRSSRKVASRAS